MPSTRGSHTQAESLRVGFNSKNLRRAAGPHLVNLDSVPCCIWAAPWLRCWGHEPYEAADVFGLGGGAGAAQPAVDVKTLHAKIGELTLENDFLEGALSKAGLLSARR